LVNEKELKFLTKKLYMLFKLIRKKMKLAVLKKAAQIKKQDGIKNAEDNNYRSVPIEDKN